MWFKHLVRFLFLALILNSCNSKIQEQKFTLINTFEDQALLEIRNTNNQPVVFTININNRFPTNQEQILENITYWSDSLGVPVYVAAWKYVAENTKHNTPITSENWICNPEIFLNSVGLGYCDDRAFVLAKLWNILGYESRVYQLKGHAVAEIFVEDKWQMFDPDHEVYYYNDKKEIASVEELEQNKQFFYQLYKSSVDELSDLIVNNDFLINKYTSTDDNQIDTSFIEEFKPIDFEFELPPNAKVKFPLTIPYINGLFYKYTKAMEVTLYPNKDTQKLKVPFVPYMVIANRDTNFIKSDTLSCISYSNIKDSIKIYYLINPRIDILTNERNTITVKSQKNLILKVDLLKVADNMQKLFDIENDTTLFSNQFNQAYLSYELLEEKYIEFLTLLEEKHKIDLSNQKLLAKKNIEEFKVICFKNNFDLKSITRFNTSAQLFLFQLWLVGDEDLLPQLLDEYRKK